MRQATTTLAILFCIFRTSEVISLPLEQLTETDLPEFGSWDAYEISEPTKTRTGFHPATPQPPQLIEQYDRRESDGRHEFRYELNDGTCVYERSYWKTVGNGYRLLARKGFYSQRLTDRRYLTVFYTADDRGYQIDSSTFSYAKPHLPDRIDVPQTITLSSTTLSIPELYPKRPTLTPSPSPPPKRNYIENNAAKVQLKTEQHQDINRTDEEYVATGVYGSDLLEYF